MIGRMEFGMNELKCLEGNLPYSHIFHLGAYVDCLELNLGV
jgi:hypothetical protein